ncbi:MAG: UDP binding domain-containing protein [Pseudomonadota bacterium]
MSTIAFVGMTHLGLVSASSVAAKGFRTLCFDPDAALIGRLSAGELPVSEPDLDDQIAGNADQTFTSNWTDLSAADVVYIAPDVPTDDRGISDLSGIEALVGQVLNHLSPEAVLVVLCQVPPGFTRGINRRPERLYYQVETLVFGRAVERAMEPERYIIGCANPADPLPPAFAEILGAFGCPILPMRYESAELAKISINMCLVASISVANTMAEVCEHIGADWSEIVPSLKLDRRIGQYSYLAPGLGIAGGNLERDLATVMRLAEAHGTDAGVVAAQVANSSHRKGWAARTVQRLGLEAATLAVWGLAYKENTHSVKNSPSLHTLAQIPDAVLHLHDPMVADDVLSFPESQQIARKDTALGALDGAMALMILTPWPVYREIAPAEIAARLAGDIVLDPYRVLDADAARAAGLRHFTLGVGDA